MKNCLFPIIALSLFAVGCSSKGSKLEELERIEQRETIGVAGTDPMSEKRRQRMLAQLDAQQFYQRARDMLDRSDFATSVEAYDELIKRYPFSDYATQGELERIYALYKNFQPERALSAADRFLREHPRHGAIDYVYYLKGLVNFDRDASALNLLPIDETKSDISSQRRSFDDFAILVQRFPGSRFAGDAYARMLYVRNRSAAHELHVVDYYIRRGAYIAAAKRAEQIIAQYPGTLAGYKALDMLSQCYEKAGLTQQAADSRRLLAAQDQALVRRARKTPISKLGDAKFAAEFKKNAASAENPSSASVEKKGIFGTIAGWFSAADTTDRGIEFVIPSAATQAEVAEDAAAAETGSTSLAAADDSAAKSGKIEVFFEPYEDGEAETAQAEEVGQE